MGESEFTLWRSFITLYGDGIEGLVRVASFSYLFPTYPKKRQRRELIGSKWR